MHRSRRSGAYLDFTFRSMVAWVAKDVWRGGDVLQPHARFLTPFPRWTAHQKPESPNRNNCGLSSDNAHRHVCRIIAFLEIAQLGFLRRISCLSLPPSCFSSPTLVHGTVGTFTRLAAALAAWHAPGVCSCSRSVQYVGLTAQDTHQKTNTTHTQHRCSDSALWHSLSSSDRGGWLPLHYILAVHCTTPRPPRCTLGMVLVGAHHNIRKPETRCLNLGRRGRRQDQREERRQAWRTGCTSAVTRRNGRQQRGDRRRRCRVKVSMADNQRQLP
jgi:hypothetical protein